ncbi:HNH endonuclease [Actinoplanes sp. TBRC 11911]|uniref:HNH endonuclease n=1 Tax=Actinoplanes sp. TBRC 11911 TaxID=2729386 RepID=UPI0037BFDA00
MDPHETHCIRCGQPVDKGLRGCTPQSRSVDHIIAIELGGARLSRDNVALAHYGCNSRHGAMVRWAKHNRRGHTVSRMIVDVDPHSL